MIWLLHYCLNHIEMIWKNIIIVIFAFDKFVLIETFAKIVAKRQIDDCFEIFSQWFFHRIVCHVCWNFDDIMICDRIYCFVQNVDFHVNDLVESNWYKINIFKNAFRRRDWLFFVLIFVHEILLNSLMYFVVRITIHFVVFAYSLKI